jgi:hypothetical protein
MRSSRGIQQQMENDYMARKLIVVATAFAMSCSGGSGLVLSISYAPETYFDFAQLTWSPPAGKQGFALQRRVVPGPFEMIQGIDGGAQTKTVQLAEFPEMVDLEFRIMDPNDTSRVSNSVQLHRGIRPPQAFSAAFSTGGGPSFVHWINSSIVADTLVLERRALQFDDSAGPWTAIAIPFSTGFTEYRDPDIAGWTDGARFEYRMVAARGAERSATVDAVTGYADLLPPRILKPTPLSNGVRLAFANQSRYATSLGIKRSVSNSGSPTTDVATLPAAATSYDDLVSPGRYVYLIDARREDAKLVVPLKSPPAVGIGISALPATWGLIGGVIDIGPGGVAARGMNAGFATAGLLIDTASTSPPYYLASGEGASKAFRTVPGSVGYRPGVVTDAGGHPHTLYVAGPASRALVDPVVHAWHDGSAWRTEELGLGASYVPVRFDVGVEGTLHASWRSGQGALIVGALIAGSWQFESVPVTTANGAGDQLSGDDAGVPHVLLKGDAGLAHLTRGASGWTTEAVPAAGSIPDWRVFAGAGRVTVVYSVDSADLTQTTIRVVSRTDAGWGVPQDLGSGPRGGNIEAARSRDGTRVAVAAKWFGATAVDGYLWILGASGTLEKRWFGGDGALATGFGFDGRAWVLDGLQERFLFPVETVQAALFEEP